MPYVRQGLPYFGEDGVAGFGSIVGEVEVRGAEGNGIDGFDGHRHDGLGPNPGDPDYGLYGFQDVEDFSGANDPSDNNFHGTFVAGVMASEFISVSDGTNTAPFLGVAPLARYYGAVFDGSGSKAGFLSLNDSLNYVTVVSGASVVNHSWGSTAATAAELDGSTFGESLLLDEYAGYSGKTGGTTATYLDRLMVIAAGNTGGLLGSPADSFNGLAVGALDVVNESADGLFDAGRMPIARVASYSSARPLADGRAGVDVVAPGTNLWSTLAINYLDPDQNGLVAGVASGTSFAAPHVTGEAALLYGAATQNIVSDKGTFIFTDHKLVKALIINSATKIPGLDATGTPQSTWQPGQVTVTDGVTNAIVPLNYAVGSGSANAAEAYAELRETGDRFWDLSSLAISGADTFYTFGQGKFTAISLDRPFLFSLTATLVWDRHVDFDLNLSPTDDSLGELTKDLLSDLDLILQREVQPGIWQDYYRSAGTLGNVEHIYLPELTGTDNYRLEVHATDIAEPDLGETYALAVSYSTVPEPGAGMLIVVGVFLASVRRPRRRISEERSDQGERIGEAENSQSSGR